jgi:hypothetical protein
MRYLGIFIIYIYILDTQTGNGSKTRKPSRMYLVTSQEVPKL